MSSGIGKSSIHKFRMSRKPPELEAARLRENQRRHRARVKARTGELEAALAATQRQLKDALEHIDLLAAEVRQLRDAVGQPKQALDSPFPEVSSPPPSSANESPSTNRQGCNCGLCSPEKVLVTTTARRFQAAIGGDDAALTHPVAQSTTISALPQVNSLEDGCALLPLPSPGESTILCRDAYSIIAQRLSDVDFDVVTESLKPGFRRALVPGGGCRVQTHILFSFVDRIT
ncbi:hypothetical protein B0T14DRAFT_249282 [Immersiella caudata]|uniref:BZIP domain-containing protein n=1 Tax=Immersiella caudata TaxID=314043 RepID=A0AA40BWS5_9PEZI|nr:hypothetical protein B0T14DRAFT_249282 [Immersiella caudata]